MICKAGRRKRPGPAYQTETQRAEKFVIHHMAVWLEKSFFTGVSSWKEHLDEENSFRALYKRILKFTSDHIYENSFGPDGMCLRYFLRCRERLLRRIWEQEAKPGFKGNKKQYRGLFNGYKRRCMGLFTVDRFDEEKLADFAAFTTRLVLEKVMNFIGKELDEPISGEEARKILERLGDKKFRKKAREDFRYFTSRYVDRIWDDYLDSESFQEELHEASRFACEEVFDRF